VSAMTANEAAGADEPKGFTQRMLGGIEKVGNKVPHPAVIFLILSSLVIVLSHLFHWLGTTVIYEVINPQTHKIEEATATVNSLLSGDGILIAEHHTKNVLPDAAGLLRRWRILKQGETSLSFYERK